MPPEAINACVQVCAYIARSLCMYVYVQVPDEIKNDPELLEAMKVLPSNYEFEIPKVIHKHTHPSPLVISLSLCGHSSPDLLYQYVNEISGIR